MAAAVASIPRNLNSFDSLRLAAAMMVFVSHFLGMAGLGEPRIALLQTTLGGAGVYIFFAMSGFLVTDSVMRGASLPFYAASRVLRVYPGLLACLTACVLLGATVTTIGHAAYWSSTETHLFVAGNLFPLGLPAFPTLPGVFDGAYWSAVNGSLWTIKYELACYLALAAVCLVSARHRQVVATLILTIGLIVMVSSIAAFDPGRGESYVEFERASFLRLATPFFAAGFLRTYLTLPRARLTYACIALAGFYVALLPLGGSTPVACALLAVIVIAVGSSPYLRIPALGKVGDLSYGIYLYAYPVSNLAVIVLLGSGADDGSRGGDDRGVGVRLVDARREAGARLQVEGSAARVERRARPGCGTREPVVDAGTGLPPSAWAHGVAPFGAIDDVVKCVTNQHACRSQRPLEVGTRQFLEILGPDGAL